MALPLDPSAKPAAEEEGMDDNLPTSTLDQQSAPPAQARTARPPSKAWLRDQGEPEEERELTGTMMESAHTQQGGRDAGNNDDTLSNQENSSMDNSGVAGGGGSGGGGSRSSSGGSSSGAGAISSSRGGSSRSSGGGG